MGSLTLLMGIVSRHNPLLSPAWCRGKKGMEANVDVFSASRFPPPTLPPPRGWRGKTGTWADAAACFALSPAPPGGFDGRKGLLATGQATQREKGELEDYYRYTYRKTHETYIGVLAC